MMKLRRLLAVLVLTLAVAGLGSVQAKADNQENLISTYNPGFESPVADNKIPGWYISSGEAKVVSDIKHSGNHSLWCSQSAKIYSDKLIKIEPGYRYHIEAWGKYKNLKFIGKRYGVGCGLEQQGADKAINGNWYDMQTYLKYGEGDTNWTTAARIWTLKDTTVYLRPFILVDAEEGSQIWFDDIKVWKEKIPQKTVETSVNAIENGSFEVRYDLGKKANRFDIKASPSLFNAYSSRAVCVEDVKHSGLASMKISGECRMISYAGYLDTRGAEAKIAVKTVGVRSSGVGAFARLVFYDKNRRVVSARGVVAIKGTHDWKICKADLKDIDIKKIRYAQWEFGMDKGSTGIAYFDDLQVNVPTTLKTLPRREKDTAHAIVDVDCTASGAIFNSPLNAFDNGASYLAYNPRIGTAGKYVEGPGRWFSERRRLGFKYIRIHDVYSPQYVLGVSKSKDELDAPEGYTYPFNQSSLISYHSQRTYYPESNEPIKPVYIEDKAGNPHFDFSGIKYILDKAILQSGCKPLIGLYGIPYDLGLHGNAPSLWDYRHYAPKDYRKWEELNYKFVRFLVDTYGKDEVRTWIFETGNEPGTEPEWHGIPGKRDDAMNEFFKFQDYTIAGARKALPDIYISGPSGSSWTSEMLDHCINGINYATGKRGTKIDALTLHNYWGGCDTDLSWRPVEEYLLVYRGYAKRYEQETGSTMDLLDTEFSPICFEGACDINHISAVRDNHILAIATLHYGYLGWKFGLKALTFFYEHPGPTDLIYSNPKSEVPEFTGTDTCVTTHGIFKPISRVAQLMSMLNGGRELRASADKEPIWALASMANNKINVLCYSFDVDPRVEYSTLVDFFVNTGNRGGKFRVTKYELSGAKANSWYLAQKMKLTQADCEKDISIVDKLNTESEPKAELLGVFKAENEKVHVKLNMPAFSAVVLVIEKAD